MDSVSSFFDLAFVGFVALFPPVNPVGTAFVVDPFMHHLTPTERKLAAGKIALYCFLICTTTLFVGSWLFKLFGISLPVVQMAGGILIFVCYAFTPAVLGRLGPRGEQIVNRLSAFLVFCVGLQIATTGLKHLMKEMS